MKFKTGKIPGEYLSKLLSHICVEDRRVIKGPEIGEDAAVIDMGDTYLLAKTDPITFISDRIGWYSININANDIAVLGGMPKWFLATVLLPEKTTDENLLNELFEDLHTACSELGITLCGGHTEVTPGLERVIIAGQMLGEVPKEKLVDKKSIKSGDKIILAKRIPIEATAIIADIKRDELKREYGEKFLQKALDFIYEPGISVVEPAKIAVESGKVNGMHDPTEGGLLGGLWELAFLSKTGFRVFRKDIPVYKEAETLCSRYHLDPLRIIASGSLIIVAEHKDSNAIIQNLHENHVPAQIIGEITNPSNGKILVEPDDKETKIEKAVIDEIGKLL